MEEHYNLDDSMDLDLIAGEAIINNYNNNDMMILRTKSLDENGKQGSYRNGHDHNSHHRDNGSLERSSTDALHSSFDASFLNSSERQQQQHQDSSTLIHPLRAAASWDGNNPGAGGGGCTEETTAAAIAAARNHSYQQQQQQHLSIEMPDLPPPGTIRKSSRLGRSSGIEASKTPVRPRFRPPGTAVKKAIGKLTPASAKRHRVPLQRRSPMRRVPPKTPRESSLTRSHSGHTPRMQGNLHDAHLAFGGSTGGGGGGYNATSFAPNSSESFDPYGTTPCFSNKKPSKPSFGTVATVASSALLETTTETADSIDTLESSLTPFRFTSFPASLPRISNGQTAERQCPAGTTGTVRKRMFAGGEAAVDALNGSRDSSMSSLHDDGHYTYSDEDDDDNDSKTQEVQDLAPSPIGTPVTRTRLNFNTVLSPPLPNQLDNPEQGAHAQDTAEMQIDAGQIDLSCPYEQKRISSFASSLSSHTLKNTSGFDDIQSASTASLTPLRGSGLGDARMESQRPATPREVQLHLQLDAAQCSPIPGIPEEEGDLSSKQSVFSNGKNVVPGFRRSASQGSSISSSIGSKMRRPLPMPDMHAFDGDPFSSSRDRSVDDTATTGSRSHPPSPKLLCPPTPVRTPAWAHSDAVGHTIFQTAAGNAKFHRANSLIATKVLLKSSPQVLDGRTSLENSVLEETSSISGMRPSAAASSVGSTLEAEDSDVETIVDDEETPMDEDESSWLHHAKTSASSRPLPQPSLQPRRSTGETVSMATTFETLSVLGSGTFADVYKVRSKVDQRLYAIKRNRRQFRGKRDREKALAEVRHMQRLQSICANLADAKEDHEKSSYSLYLLFFFQAWQEEGHFFCQTELCCRDTCREFMDSLRLQWIGARTRYRSLRQLPAPEGALPGSEADLAGRLVPETTIWKICHDVAAGLSHIHSHGLVHYDIHPSNMFFIPHGRFGAMCKIGDFGMAGDIGSSEDGQEGDQHYMAPELMSSGVKHPSADIFSLGLTLYELASELDFDVPSDGPHWHELRSGQHRPRIPSCRSNDLLQLIQLLLSPGIEQRPTADTILTNSKVASAGSQCDYFLRDYIRDIDEFDRCESERAGVNNREEQTPHGPSRVRVCSPSLGSLPPIASMIYSPEAAPS